MKDDRIKSILEKIKSEQRYLSGLISTENSPDNYGFIVFTDVTYRNKIAYGGCVVMGSKENVISS